MDQEREKEIREGKRFYFLIVWTVAVECHLHFSLMEINKNM